MATRQEIFDKIVTDMVVQGRPSFAADAAGGNFCAYRGRDGAKCAIGTLIPQEMYDPEMEQKSVDALIEMFPEVEGIPAFNILGYSLLMDIQNAHDHILDKDHKYFVEWFLRDMRITAYDHGLDWHFKEV